MEFTMQQINQFILHRCFQQCGRRNNTAEAGNLGSVRLLEEFQDLRQLSRYRNGKGRFLLFHTLQPDGRSKTRKQNGRCAENQGQNNQAFRQRVVKRRSGQDFVILRYFIDTDMRHGTLILVVLADINGLRRTG